MAQNFSTWFRGQENFIRSGLLPDDEAGLVFDCWSELWKGTASSQRQLKTLDVERTEEGAIWRLAAR